MLYFPRPSLKVPDQLAEFDVSCSKMNVVLHVPRVAPIDQFVILHRHALRVIGELESVLQDVTHSATNHMGAGDLSDDAELGG